MDRTDIKLAFGGVLCAVAFVSLLYGAEHTQTVSATVESTPNKVTLVTVEDTAQPTQIVAEAQPTVEEPEVKLSLPEQYPEVYENDGFTMLTYVVSHEVGNCSYESKKAVAHTVLNRIASPEFPNTAYEVLNVPGQYDAIWDSYYCGQFVPSDDTIAACEEALCENDFTLGATYYYNPNITGYLEWFESLQICYIDSNGQRFFKAW